MYLSQVLSDIKQSCKSKSKEQPHHTTPTLTTPHPHSKHHTTPHHTHHTTPHHTTLTPIIFKFRLFSLPKIKKTHVIIISPNTPRSAFIYTTSSRTVWFQ